MFDLGIIHVQDVKTVSKTSRMCRVIIEMPYRSLEPHMYKIYLVPRDDAWKVFEIVVENFFE